MTFSLTVNLDVTDRPTVVIGGGPEAVDRATALVGGGARVRVVTPAPDPRLEALADDGRITLARRGYRPGDLAGAFVAYVTREDATDVTATWAEAEAERVLLSTLDDVPRCHFSTPSVLRRGDLSLTIATRGKAPALAKRLRRQLEDDLGPELGDLVDVLDEAKQACLPRRVPFAEWAARWAIALADVDALRTEVVAGRRDAVRDQVIATLTTPTDVALPCDATSSCAPGACLGRRAGLCDDATATDATATDATATDDDRQDLDVQVHA